MLEHEYLNEFGIHVLRAREPFDLDQLYTLIVNEYGRDGADGIGAPVLFDLREVDVTLIAAPEIRRHMMKKSVLDESVTKVVLAYVVNGIAAQAAVRMANTYSELMGLSGEDRTLVTDDLGKAVEYLAAIAGLSASEVAMLEERVLPSVVTAFPRGSA